jgi:hypothetical protein
MDFCRRLQRVHTKQMQGEATEVAVDSAPLVRTAIRRPNPLTQIFWRLLNILGPKVMNVFTSRRAGAESWTAIA